ncbi:uncharacterized protein [Primulina eburnea]|uniref:uncharacterized protein n=1 Tax=Primulina eburnea TaxID=1245227 RepID=UPI003C6C094C
MARVRASILVSSPSKIKGFYDKYEKTFYGPVVIANSLVTSFLMVEALRGLLEMQLRHPEVMSPDVSLMGGHFYTWMSLLAQDEDKFVNGNLVDIVKGIDPKWPCLSWEKPRRILIPVYRHGYWFLLKLVKGVNKCSIFDLQRRHDPNVKALNEDIDPMLINTARLLSIVGNNPHSERAWYIKLHDEFRSKIKQFLSIFVLAVVGYSLPRKSEQIFVRPLWFWSTLVDIWVDHGAFGSFWSTTLLLIQPTLRFWVDPCSYLGQPLFISGSTHVALGFRV